MATPTVLEIPKTTSGPADPRAPSILTTLPPEIRNRIYEYIFKRDRPVLLHDGHARLSELRQGLSWIAQDQADPLLGGIVERNVQREDFHHDFDGYVGLLLSCRQVYHEAVGILYGGNTFLFSRALTNHLKSACGWLTDIGSHYQLLSRVQIDADAFGRTRSEVTSLLSLLRLIWNHSDTKSKFVFALSGWPLPKRKRLGYERKSPVPFLDLLNRLLFTLGTEDALNLRQYARHPRLLSSIVITQRVNSSPVGMVDFVDPKEPRFHNVVRRSFHISDNGAKVQWVESRHSNILHLPSRLLSHINSYVLASDALIVLDLDKKKAQGYHVGLSGVNKHLRYRIDREREQLYNGMVIQASTREATTDFKGFRALQDWFDVDRFAELIRPDACWDEERSISIVLKFDLSTPRSTKDLRIDISKLLSMLHFLRAEPGSTIQLVDGSDTKPIVWHDLACRLFLLISDVMKQCPSEAGRPLPQIWIDGHGTILRATYPATAISGQIIIPYSNTIDSPTEVRKEGYANIKGIWNNTSIQCDTYDFPNTDTLIGLWFYLGGYFWSDGWSFEAAEEES
ncbi:uncharacterized protein J4E84_007989 [Alternaria hordeiaustralica]|uniref:uncharacterized protein n=1 Tax=Alternaria hordeiaustralica TaxID=1187925 RepID=UPI0020C50955|nr:uncharacterized protein J4E84_007989 [Alternaria hordeiaustralica]KAI4680341.1 hypothetical protein J4E84_007989 [Alternaria hordeiaustralica]